LFAVLFAVGVTEDHVRAMRSAALQTRDIYAAQDYELLADHLATLVP
jgi:hypothetical protein